MAAAMSPKALKEKARVRLEFAPATNSNERLRRVFEILLKEKPEIAK